MDHGPYGKRLRMHSSMSTIRVNSRPFAVHILFSVTWTLMEVLQAKRASCSG